MCEKRHTEVVGTTKPARLLAERIQAGISGGGDRAMFHGAVMPTERALNVFNIT